MGLEGRKLSPSNAITAEERKSELFDLEYARENEVSIIGIEPCDNFFDKNGNLNESEYGLGALSSKGVSPIRIFPDGIEGVLQNLGGTYFAQLVVADVEEKKVEMIAFTYKKTED